VIVLALELMLMMLPTRLWVLGLWTNRRISVLLSESDGPSPARLQAA